MRKLNKIHIEVDRVRVICGHPQLYATWCAGCGKDVDLVTFNEAANITGTSIDAMVEQAAKGKLHLGIRPEALLICLNSLLKAEKFVSAKAC